MKRPGEARQAGRHSGIISTQVHVQAYNHTTRRPHADGTRLASKHGPIPHVTRRTAHVPTPTAVPPCRGCPLRAATPLQTPLQASRHPFCGGPCPHPAGQGPWYSTAGRGCPALTCGGGRARGLERRGHQLMDMALHSPMWAGCSHSKGAFRISLTASLHRHTPRRSPRTTACHSPCLSVCECPRGMQQWTMCIHSPASRCGRASAGWICLGRHSLGPSCLRGDTAEISWMQFGDVRGVR